VSVGSSDGEAGSAVPRASPRHGVTPRPMRGAREVLERVVDGELRRGK
jgi:hypothetical protein